MSLGCVENWRMIDILDTYKGGIELLGISLTGIIEPSIYSVIQSITPITLFQLS